MNDRRTGKTLTRSKQPLNSDQCHLLTRITDRIRQSLELQHILETTVAEVRGYLKVDRVKIYKFDDDGNGQVIAESRRGDRLASLLGLYFPAGDIPPQARELFCKARVRSIVNVDRQELRLSEPNPLPSSATGELSAEEVRRQPLKQLLGRPVDPCHIEYLRLMGVQSSMVIPIVEGSRLWGLLIAHHAKPKSFSPIQQQIVGTIAEQVEIAIAQASLLSQTQAQVRREATVNQISVLLHSQVASPSNLELALQEIVSALQSCGGILCLSEDEASQCYTWGSIPHLPPQKWIQHCQNFSDPHRSSIEIDLPQLKALFPSSIPEEICSAIVVALHYGEETVGNLTLFRAAIDTERLWAGNREQDIRQNRPRQSFHQWREIVRGLAPPWTTGDRQLLDAVSQHLAMALMQERLYRRERQQRILVEMKNRELDAARCTAEEANRMKSDFLASTNHELRTPLASTLNYLKLLKEGFYDNDDELREYIDAAHLSAEHLTEILSSVLDIAKIEADRMSLEATEFDLPSLLDRLRRMFEPESHHRQILLTVDCSVDRLYSDENKLRQILINLLSNAFKFTETGEIRLQVTSLPDSPEPMVLFSVGDTGIGIEAHQKDTLFEAFVQEDGSIRRRYGGTGLGLTICKKFVETMGGRIWIESPGKNLGTIVYLTLPSRIRSQS